MAILPSLPPYEKYKCRGPYLHAEKSGRKIIFMTKDGKSTGTSYARYLYAIHLGKKIPAKYDVDHIDGDVCNDKISNLQLLTRKQNRQKGPSLAKKLRQRKVLSVIMTGNANTVGSKNGLSKLTEKEVKKIKAMLCPYHRGLDAELAKKFGVSRETISSIRRNKAWKHV